MNSETVFVTPFGVVRHSECPDLFRELLCGRFRHDGLPDRRSKATMRAWDAIIEFSRSRAV